MTSSRSFMGVMVHDDAAVVMTTLCENALNLILSRCGLREQHGRIAKWRCQLKVYDSEEGSSDAASV
eukprot:2570796-Pleurochrysis_carterae.AAC.1